MEKKDKYFLVSCLVATDNVSFPLMIPYRDEIFVNLDKVNRVIDNNWKHYPFKVLNFRGCTITGIIECTKLQQDYFFAQDRIITPPVKNLITD